MDHLETATKVLLVADGTILCRTDAVVPLPFLDAVGQRLVASQTPVSVDARPSELMTLGAVAHAFQLGVRL